MPDSERWEGWIEFEPDNGGAALRTPRESVQPNRQDLQYWATGLSTAYLEGALERALHPPKRTAPPPHRTPAYDGPAPRADAPRGGPAAPPHAILDPFHVWMQGEDVLREELAALEGMHLRNIIRAFDLVPESGEDLDRMAHATLVELIVGGVRRRTPA
jgi:hypothetical protein